MNQAISVKQAYTSTPWRDMAWHDTTLASGYGDVRVFSEIAKVFPELQGPRSYFESGGAD